MDRPCICQQKQSLLGGWIMPSGLLHAQMYRCIQVTRCHKGVHCNQLMSSTALQVELVKGVLFTLPAEGSVPKAILDLNPSDEENEKDALQPQRPARQPETQDVIELDSE